MIHLIISREYPPAAYQPGGIGAYVANIARLMAENGETVHIIGERWKGAAEAREAFHDGHLIVHRIAVEDPIPARKVNGAPRLAREPEGLKATPFPTQWFAWQAAFLAERLIEEEGIEVVEGQEWEAPLYYLLLRRALGIGPARQPPCIVHLHSSTEFIRHYNGALTTPPPYLLMKRMEEFCIRAADALMCPSHYFSRQCAAHYGLPEDRIKVIHLPLGFASVPERDPQTWARGSICFVGRLEPRKGIIEWIEAALRVVPEHPDLVLDIVGTDIWGLQPALTDRIPRDIRPRFRFHGAKTRAELPGILAGARAGVVPSRWENFPNVCIEAMAAGLPVIATRLGGMVEMLEDGRTGWLTADTGVAGMVDGLAQALRRCLAASPAERAAMGRAAAETVDRICNNARTVAEQIAYRGAVARAGASRSSALVRLPPSGLPEAGPPVSALADGRGAGIVLRAETITAARPAFDALRGQTVAPRIVAVVLTRPVPAREDPRIGGGWDDVLVVFAPERAGADAWNAGYEAARLKEPCGFWVFLDEDDLLLPDYLAYMEAVFAYRPQAGIIAAWTERLSGSRPLDAPLCPEAEYQLRANEVTPASAFRAEALGDASPFRPGMPREYDVWDLANGIIARGWQSVAYPEILARRRSGETIVAWPQSTALRVIRAELLARFAGTMPKAALGLVDDVVAIPLAEAVSEHRVERSLMAFALHALKIIALHPRRAARAIRRRGRAVLAAIGGEIGPEKKRSAA